MGSLVSSCEIQGNVGYKTENAGTVALLNGTTSVNVTHGCDYTPSAGDIDIHAIEALGNSSYCIVDSITSSQFTVHVDTDPVQDVDFAWSVEKH